MGEPQSTRTDDIADVVVYIVAYFEVMPPSTGEAAALLRQYRRASRQDAGCLQLEVLQQRGRPDHFAVVEQWQDLQAFEAHGTAAHTRQWQTRLEALRISPYDARPHQGLAIGPPPAAAATGATYVLTHADAIPPAKDDAIAALQELAEAGRGEDGNVRFDVLQQHSRANHFTIVEVWRDQRAVETHAMAAHTRRFRDVFQPMSGSLYDERLYDALD